MNLSKKVSYFEIQSSKFMNRLILGIFTQALVTLFCFTISVSLSSVVASDNVKESNNSHFSNSEAERETTFPEVEIEPVENPKIQSSKVQRIRSALNKISNKSRKNQSNTILKTIDIHQKPVSDIALPEYETEQEFSTTNVRQFQVKNRKVVAPITISSVGKNIDTEIDTEKVAQQTSAQQNNAVSTKQLATSPIVAQNSVEESLEEIEKIEKELRNVSKIKIRSYYSSPSMSIYVPVGYSSDKNTGFVTASYQERTRFANKDDAAIGFGVGLGDSRKSVGVVLSYTTASFGGSRDFGSGGFNVKVHRRFKGDWAAAVGMNGFLNIGGNNDFDNSLYAVATKIFRTRNDINKPFSRVAVTAGIGNGQFRTENSIYDDKDNFNVFGSVALRVHSQASLIAEWTGQDLALGASIAPFKNIPFVVTPAVRDIAGPGAGANDGARFVLGAGFGFKF